jgi:hypothetical protein
MFRNLAQGESGEGEIHWMTVLSEDEIGTRCVAAAFALCVVHILTIVGTDYQVYAVSKDNWSFSGSNSDDLLPVIFGILVNYGTFLSPVIILLVVRRVCILVGIIAIPILIFFAFRMHHVWQFHWFGINSMARQKGDELGWATLIFEMLSAVIVTPVLFGVVVWKLVDSAQRAWRR